MARRRKKKAITPVEGRFPSRFEHDNKYISSKRHDEYAYAERVGLNNLTILWVALVVKYNLKGQKEGIHDVAFVRARDKEEAIKLLSENQWNDDLWVKSKSKTSVVQIWPFTHIVFHKIVPKGFDPITHRVNDTEENEDPAPAPARRRRRRN